MHLKNQSSYVWQENRMNNSKLQYTVENIEQVDERGYLCGKFTNNIKYMVEL